MPQHFLQARARPIEDALMAALATLPRPCQPVAAHILQAGGKRLRPLLTVLCARLLGYAKDDVYSLAASMEMLHAATLLHDDVLDNADKRRGRIAAHLEFGTPQAILAGDALLACGNALVAAFEMPALSLCYSRATSQTAAGEILEMSSLGRPGLSHEEYLAIARGKTACLISEACRMGALVARADREQCGACASFGENLGLAFQIVDDVLDFAPESQTGKPSGGDAREGKMTPPLRFYRESLDERPREEFDLVFSRKGISSGQAREISRAVVEGGFAARALQLADSRIARAKEALDKLPDGEENRILRQMADYVRERRK